jgi:hypothetical protein
MKKYNKFSMLKDGIMLKRFSKKICPLLGLVIGTIGCGKQITEDQGTDDNQRLVQNQELPAALVITLDPATSFVKDYEIPRNGNILMPEILQVDGEASTGSEVLIQYNVDDEGFDYECVYRKILPSQNLILKNCYDSTGEVMTQTTEFELPIYFAKKIKIEITTGTINFTISAIFNVDWK